MDLNLSVFQRSAKDSINRKVANALAELAPAGLKLGIVEIGRLPIYNQDGDDDPPAEWTAFRERIRAADAVLFVTPEHNRSVPAASWYRPRTCGTKTLSMELGDRSIRANAICRARSTASAFSGYSAGHRRPWHRHAPDEMASRKSPSARSGQGW